jgi:kumamolisin
MLSSSETGESHRSGVFTLAVLASAAFTMLSPAPLRAQQQPARGTIIVPATSVVRPQDRGVRAHTNHLIFIPAKGGPSKPGGGSGPTGETPGSLACVYQTAASHTSGCPKSATSLPVGGSGVIAIVDAYDYPTAYNDFDVFSNKFGLPLHNAICANGQPCFTKVGATGTLPRSNGGWAQEEALDIEWSHAMAPNAQIILVEAASNSFSNLLQAVQVATNYVVCGSSSCPNGGSGKGEVSMSWGGSEFSGETADDGYFYNSGVTYFASSGDTGGVVIWPSASTNVVSAGGTSVNRDSKGNFTNETAWSGTGGGPSQYEPIPGYQSVVKTVSLNGKRGTPDFSFDANPSTGVSVYDSTSYQGLSGWLVFGGTSVASPSLAGIVNLANQFNSLNNEQSLIYDTYSGIGPCSSASAFNDITSGSAGSYSAGTGWDFVTGVGSNKGTCGK